MNATTRIFGIGSPFGADRTGWILAERLSKRSGLNASAISVATPLEILDHLDGCKHLMIVDACLTGAEPGTVLRLSWPSDILDSPRSYSSHGFGVGETLLLAQQLGRLPESVVLYCLEVTRQHNGSPDSDRAIPGMGELERRLLEELSEIQTESPERMRRRDA